MNPSIQFLIPRNSYLWNLSSTSIQNSVSYLWNSCYKFLSTLVQVILENKVENRALVYFLKFCFCYYCLINIWVLWELRKNACWLYLAPTLPRYTHFPAQQMLCPLLLLLLFVYLFIPSWQVCAAQALLGVWSSMEAVLLTIQSLHF